MSPAISRDEEHFLLEALSMSSGTSVFFVVTPLGEARRQAMERLAGLLSGWHIVQTKVTLDRTLDLRELKRRIQETPRGLRPMVWVETEGLEAALSDENGEEAERARMILQDINFKRDALPILDVPILLWTSVDGMRAFAIFAADLFSVRTAVLGLEESPKGQPVGGIRDPLIHRAFLALDVPMSLPPAELDGRIRLYEESLRAELKRRSPNLPRIALLHNELAQLYALRGDIPSALAHLGEAHKAYRELVGRDPEVFLPALARTLNNLAVWLLEAGRAEEALAAAEEASTILRDLAFQRRGEFRVALARSLGVLGAALLALGQAREAKKSFEEGLEILASEGSALEPDLRDLVRALRRGRDEARFAGTERPE